MISELLNINTVAVDVEVKNWEEAVIEGGKLLLNNGSIEERYIQAMIDTVHEFGPYIVIEKGIALSHARPEEGVIRNGLALSVLKTPVCFGNEENDPVKLVISLCATDSNSHVDVIADLASMIMSDDIMERVFTCSDKKELLEIVSAIDDASAAD